MPTPTDPAPRDQRASVRVTELETPALLLDTAKMHANITRMRERMTALGVRLRPHAKTAKCVEVTRAMLGAADGPIAVSTLREADVLAAHGFTDITYAVGIAPNKFTHVAHLLERGIRIQLTLDSVEAARSLAAASAGWPAGASVLVEIDTDGHRAGVKPDDAMLCEIAAVLAGGAAPVSGVLTHAGASYDCRDEDAIRRIAEQERAGAVHAAERLRAAGHAVATVSVGSTPTALFAEKLEGVTEVRAGVYVFFDLVMAGIGVCSAEDIAISVLASVIGHQRQRGWTIVDAGWMAMSRDRGTASQPIDQGYGLVCALDGTALPEYTLIAANQEHGIVAHRSGDPSRALDLPIGTLLRILPNHACATAAQFDHYLLLADKARVGARWQRFGGW